MLANAQERFRTQERLLLARANGHKKQSRYHRRQTQNTMERLRELRENMARLGIKVEVVKQK
jgi:hypothetical protein